MVEPVLEAMRGIVGVSKCVIVGKKERERERAKVFQKALRKRGSALWVGVYTMSECQV